MQHRLNHGTAFNHIRPVTLSPASRAELWRAQRSDEQSVLEGYCSSTGNSTTRT